MKFLGQHFLNNKKAIGDIVAAVEVTKGDVIIEIGPGAGALTKPLAELCTKVGAKLFAIEKDTKLVIDIQKNIPAVAGHVEHGDALELLPSLVLRLTSTPLLSYPSTHFQYKIVGNIPYYITGKLLRIIGELAHKPSRTVLMIQKEVAERVSAKVPHMNLLAAATQYWGDIKMLFTLKPKDFTPPPEVSSAVIEIVPRPPLLRPYLPTPLFSLHYYSFIHAVFKQPRKTLLNNLSDGFPEFSKQKIAEIIKQNGFLVTVRGQDLDVPILERLALAFMKQKGV